MKTQEAIKYFGGKRQVAEALQLSVQAVQAWGDNVPPLRAFQIKEIMQGARFSPKAASQKAK